MAGGDWIKAADSEFALQVIKHSTAATNFGATVGLTAQQTTNVNNDAVIFPTDLTTIQTTRQTLAGQIDQKDADRDAAEGHMRENRNVAAASVNLTAEIAAAFDLPFGPPPSPPPPAQSRPVGVIDTGQRLQHTIHFRDEATPTSKAKPAGVRGCQIWITESAAPASVPADLNFIALDTRTPYVLDFAAADANKVMHYWLRWERNDNSAGPWSEVVAATVVG